MLVGVVLVSVTALAVANPERDHPPKRARPVAGVNVGTPAPVAVTGADPAGTAELVLAVYVENEIARMERERLELEAQLVAEYLAAVEAQRVAESRRLSSPPAPSGGARAPAGGTVWDELAQCESGGRWDIDTGNGYSGGLQITGHEAGTMTREAQIAWAERILAAQGWGAWPACSARLGLR